MPKYDRRNPVNFNFNFVSRARGLAPTKQCQQFSSIADPAAKRSMRKDRESLPALNPAPISARELSRVKIYRAKILLNVEGLLRDDPHIFSINDRVERLWSLPLAGFLNRNFIDVN